MAYSVKIKDKKSKVIYQRGPVYVKGKGVAQRPIESQRDAWAEEAACGCGINCCEGTLVLPDQVTGDGVVLSIRNGALFIGDVEGSNPSTETYRALLTQTGTAAPVATVLENDLSAAIVWAYVSPGVYTGTLAGAFPATSFVTIFNNSLDEDVSMRLVRTSANVITLSTSDTGLAANSLLSSTPIQIIVYS